ncbi:MAG: hypothetical protein AAGF12_27665 [Myxococcota bacterium]
MLWFARRELPGTRMLPLAHRGVCGSCGFRIAALGGVLVLLLVGGCGGDDAAPLPTGEGGVDAAVMDAAVDAPATGCGAGQHMCPSGCVDDLPNRPDMGCQNGCGDPCPTPMNARATCGDDGQCSFECIEPAVLGPDGCGCPAMSCEAQGFTCGAADDMCGGALDCGSCPMGSTCVDNQCACAPDTAEPNDARSSANDLGSLNDGRNETLTFEEFNLHRTDDEDWFTFDVTDGGSLLDNPGITITLKDIPTDGDYELTAWYVCSSGDDDTMCLAGRQDNTLGRGCNGQTDGSSPETVELATDCERFGLGDDGTLYIRVESVRASSSCAPYTLELSID